MLGQMNLELLWPFTSILVDSISVGFNFDLL